jgi:hypothetical protein
MSGALEGPPEHGYKKETTSFCSSRVADRHRRVNDLVHRTGQKNGAVCVPASYQGNPLRFISYFALALFTAALAPPPAIVLINTGTLQPVGLY